MASYWRAIMNAADAAKYILLSDRSMGEQDFADLLAEHPDDGMIFFKRGEAYEIMGENELAANDFRRAEALFPMPQWKERARHALNRVSH